MESLYLVLENGAVIQPKLGVFPRKYGSLVFMTSEVEDVHYVTLTNAY